MSANVYADPGQFNDAWYGSPGKIADPNYASPGRLVDSYYASPGQVTDAWYGAPGTLTDPIYSAPQGYDPLALARWWAAEQNAGGQWFGNAAVQPANAWGGYGSYNPQMFGLGQGGFLEDTTSRALAALAVVFLVKKFWPKRRRRNPRRR